MTAPKTATTRQFANALGISQQTLRNANHRHGNWRGITPKKHPITGRLAWPLDDAAHLIALVQGGA